MNEKNCVRRMLHKGISKEQMSDSFFNSAFLALSGGFQDAYTYNTRDGVFSNAQTGNVVLMSQCFMEGKWQQGIRFLFPLFAFMLGVLVAENVQNRFESTKHIDWRQGILLLEIGLLSMVGFIPGNHNLIATCLVSFACAMQVQSFRRLGGNVYATTMCIGNLRSGTEALSLFIRNRKREHLKKVGYYFGVIFIFAVGAGLGGVLSVRYGIQVIWLSCVMLFVSFCLMYIEKDKSGACKA